MRVIPVLFGHRLAKSTAVCRPCAETQARAAGIALAIRVPRRVLALAVIASAGLAVAAVNVGGAAWFGAGITAGIVVCSAYVRSARRDLLRGPHQTHAKAGALVELSEQLGPAEASAGSLGQRDRDREHQIAQLLLQFSILRQRLADIATTSLPREAGNDLLAPRPLEAIYFTWGLQFDGPRVRLELQTLATSESPTRLRIVDRDLEIVAVSGIAVISLEGDLEFQVEAPIDLIVDLDERRELDYAIEALVGDQWRPVRLKDSSQRTWSVAGVPGRRSRAPAVRSPALLGAPIHDRRSPLN